VDFDWTDEEIEFRDALRTFIEANIRPGWTMKDRDMPGSTEAEAVKTFCGAMGEAGFLTPHWPAEYGGRDASPWEQLIISEETWGAGEPRGGQYMNTNWIGPALMAFGTEAQKQHHLPLISSGAANWCQGFSEPDAGSDLAALQTQAVRDGDAYIVNGQKVWTSYAHAADYCFLLVRTDTEAPKREGITILLVPMDLAGIDVRDIPIPFTEHLLHEVHFTDVEVPVSERLGDENRGWDIVRSVLANERVGIARHEHSERVLDETVELAEAAGIDTTGPTMAQTLGRAYAWCEAARTMNYVAVGERIEDPLGRRPLAAVSRSITGPMEGVVSWACQSTMGDQALEADTDVDRQLLTGTTAPIAAGAIDVQLNLIARLCLDLPRGP
jgi:alkylation response protein AidB-like acyl-CoA dehydrogenase